jgi:hypothetical protein
MVAAGALLVPASVALASTSATQGPGFNASCSNGKGGNYPWTEHLYNHLGNVERAAATCLPAPPPGDWVPVDPT